MHTFSFLHTSARKVLSIGWTVTVNDCTLQGSYSECIIRHTATREVTMVATVVSRHRKCASPAPNALAHSYAVNAHEENSPARTARKLELGHNAEHVLRRALALQWLPLHATPHHDRPPRLAPRRIRTFPK